MFVRSHIESRVCVLGKFSEECISVAYNVIYIPAGRYRRDYYQGVRSSKERGHSAWVPFLGQVGGGNPLFLPDISRLAPAVNFTAINKNVSNFSSRLKRLEKFETFLFIFVELRRGIEYVQGTEKRLLGLEVGLLEIGGPHIESMCCR